MTHEELLDKIAQAGLEPHGNVMPTHLVLALRAVVELHKPMWGGVCGQCEGGAAYDASFADWPCNTIQAIEKELA